MTKLVIDPKKLLGFKLEVSGDGLKMGGKAGTKTGTKTGAKTGSKAGARRAS